jgi:hypothetical protein
MMEILKAILIVALALFLVVIGIAIGVDGRVIAESGKVQLIGSTPDGKVEFYKVTEYGIDCVAAVGHLHGKTVAIACP